MIDDQADHRRARERRDEPHQQVLARRQVHQVVGQDRRQARRVPHAACADVRCEGPPVGGRSRQPPHRDLRSGRQLPRVALQFSRVSGFFIRGDLLYAIDSESGPLNHPNWRDGVRIGPVDEDRVTAFIPPFERDDRALSGRGRRRHRGRRRRHRVRRRRTELVRAGGRRIHQVLGKEIAVPRPLDYRLIAGGRNRLSITATIT